MILLENCAGSAESAILGAKGGADRIELCSALEADGLTPSYGEMKRAIKALDIPVNVMIRPRSGNFVYSGGEIASMLEDIRIARELGANGVVFGVLDSEGNINLKDMERLMTAAAGMDVTFHRAFDCCADRSRALEEIISLGCRTILSSGGAAGALEGAAELARLIKQAAGRIVMMPGCGVRPENIAEIASVTGAKEIHLSASSLNENGCRMTNPEILLSARRSLEKII
ncbi:MAG: copper homeostasis protein CutC [Bacteroidales bacterium]|nr:copper homeostasis protein CutC [Bacteroidales bacterium]